MFLTPDNKLKTKWLAYGAAITFVLVILGILGLDRTVYPILNNPECNPWFMDGGFGCDCAFVIGKVFSAKMWLLITGVLLLVVFVKKSINSKIKYKNTRNHFSLIVFAKDVIAKVRTNYAFLVFSSVALAACTTGILKVLIGRPRPMMLSNTEFNNFIFDWAFNSMPSGHTAATFAGLVMVGMLAPKIKPITWTLAIIIGVSRVYIGAHWPSDVIFGAFIGMVAADIVKYLAFKRK